MRESYYLGVYIGFPKIRGTFCGSSSQGILLFVGVDFKAPVFRNPIFGVPDYARDGVSALRSGTLRAAKPKPCKSQSTLKLELTPKWGYK